MKFAIHIILYSMLLPTLSLAAQSECVILLHGMGRTAFSMGAIESSLAKQHYHVWNKSYPGLSQSVEELSAPAIEAGLDYCRSKQAQGIHFVTHSLGGILVRYYLQDHSITGLGRIVMLAPPNRGSEVADEMKDGFFYQTIMGPAAQELGTDANSLPNSLKPIAGEIGIIAGRTDGEPWFLPGIPGEDDGKVAVERTKLAEMKDFLLVNVGHTFIMDDDEVIRQIAYFLKHGVFDQSKLLQGDDGNGVE
ncbi:MAG: alpha/beta hydrolase [Candidatus Thiodiazotropha sp.]